MNTEGFFLNFNFRLSINYEVKDQLFKYLFELSSSDCETINILSLIKINNYGVILNFFHNFTWLRNTWLSLLAAQELCAFPQQELKSKFGYSSFFFPPLPALVVLQFTFQKFRKFGQGFSIYYLCFFPHNLWLVLIIKSDTNVFTNALLLTPVFQDGVTDLLGGKA